MTNALRYRELAEAAWRWVLDQVRYDDRGPWIPWSITDPPAAEPPWDRDGMHSGIGGLGHLLAEVRVTRPWTSTESAMAAAIADRIRDGAETKTDVTFFDGLVSDIGVLALLGEPGIDAVVDRLLALELVTLADPAHLADGGFAVPRRIPHKEGMDELTWNWCHGPAGTLSLFVALGEAGVGSVAGEAPESWLNRCLHSLRASGIPERRWPGFWDNDGRCCGTVGVGAAVLDHDPGFIAI